jgi:hypothetical protein
VLVTSDSSKLAAEGSDAAGTKIEAPQQGLELIIHARQRPRERGIIS